MTNRIAIVLGLLLAAAIAIDYVLFGNQHFIFLAKKLANLIEWMAFWR